ncbi:hypothetical protein [Arthrobacter sp. IK3]|uniref:hypothetical protein n=1 Tax=Arthrobacter sp. IK3 TaxID=3448169 RepID=UPI003EE2D4AE
MQSRGPGKQPGHKPGKYRDESLIPDFSSGVVRFPYRREPYARALLHLVDGGSETRDVKVTARTGDSAHLNVTFLDESRDNVTVVLWIPARDAVRIPASESSWRDPYDLDWD